MLNFPTRRSLVFLALPLCLGVSSVSRAIAGDTLPAKLPDVVTFNRDVRPILSDKCYACHGPDKNKREAELRLDSKEGLLGAEPGKGTVIPGDAKNSKLWQRISSNSEDERMPPRKSGKSLSDQERQILRRWIEQGGKWEQHWSFLPITRPQPPAVDAQHAPFVKNDIDKFILQSLGEHGLAPSPEADRTTLLRRLRFDLTGLPPSTEEADRFLKDDSSASYEATVDRLLASPQYGERMAMWWLDLVRYADSVGYHGDQPVSVWPFRDYVIASFNANKPFDKFTLEQLAGDLLPSATVEDKVASGYNRLGMMSAEGGVQPKEYLAKYIAERVRNLSGTWLGVTFGCCECHDHKYDPFLSKDFYSLEAFFADIEERGLYSGANADGNWGPRIQLPTSEQVAKRATLDQEIAAAKKEFETETPELIAAREQWEKSAKGTKEKVPDKVAAVLAIEKEKRSDQQKAELTAHYRAIAPSLDAPRKRLADLEKQRADLEALIPITLITASVTPRPVRVLPRGNWLDESHPELLPAFPGVLNPSQPPPHEGRLNRADLARWVASPQNPLTARVFVNRMWQQFFGAGLSKKVDDHGAQGDGPSHPELLDWLGGQFIDSGWNVKHVVKLIVMSGTYRQSSAVSRELEERDPENRWLARQGRFRLRAETVRDNALAVSGLLVGKIGGPSVKPYQPPGYWAYLNFPAREWSNGTGDDLYRRGLYTHWQRQYLHPAMAAFDAPSREECTAQRARSNTPLQSLVLMNDAEFVEAARAFAASIVQQGGSTMPERIQWAFRRALSRSPTPAETNVVESLAKKHLAEYAADSAAVDQLLAIGAHPVPDKINRAELAAWTSVARTILNIHETMTRN